MDIKEVKRLIRMGENSYIEFKAKANHPDKIIREIVAFANTNGGELFIGVADDKSIKGLRYPEEDQFVMDKAIKNLCRPKIICESSILTLPEGKILHYHIQESEKKPHYAFLKKYHRYGKAFIRVEDRSIQASPEVCKILKHREKNKEVITFEDSTSRLFKYFETNSSITLSQYRQLTGLNKKLASNKLVSLALSGALKIQPNEVEDLFVPVSGSY